MFLAQIGTNMFYVSLAVQKITFASSIKHQAIKPLLKPLNRTVSGRLGSRTGQGIPAAKSVALRTYLAVENGLSCVFQYFLISHDHHPLRDNSKGKEQWLRYTAALTHPGTFCAASAARLNAVLRFYGFPSMAFRLEFFTKPV